MSSPTSPFMTFLQTHGLSVQTPPDAQQWQTLLSIVQAQLDHAADSNWKRLLMKLQLPTFMVDARGQIQSWNEGCQDMLGYTGSIVGQALHDLMPSPLDRLRLDTLLRRTLQGEPLRGVDLRLLNAEGQVILTVGSMTALCGDTTSEAQVMLTCAPLPGDLGSLDRQSFYEQMLHALPAPLVVLDAQGRYVFCNEGSIRNPEIREWIIGKTDEEYMQYRGFDPAFLERRMAYYEQAIREKRAVIFEEVFENTERGTVVQARTYTPVFDARGNLDFMLGYGIEMTELRQTERALLALNNELEARVQARTAQLEAANRQIQHDAFHDPLTGLPNRALFTDRLEQAIARARQPEGPQYAVLFLDTDRFKNINDTLGHPAGDALLRELAGRLRAALPTSDTVARQGGDEFTILLEPVHSLEQVTLVTERLQQELSRPVQLQGLDISVSTSLGIVMGDSSYTTATEVLRDADIAMYRAKAAGRGGYQVFQAEMREQTIRQGRLEQELRSALARGELRVHYQAIVELRREVVTGFEALVRWEHPERGLVPPGEFLHVAVESGLMRDIDRFVLRQACLDMKARQRQFPYSPRLSLSVNFSAEHFTLPETVDFLKSTLQETEFDPQLLNIEITEGVLLGQPQVVEQILHQLHLDDFGTGYSSLSYLHHYPLSTLKIDRSFVSSMLKSESSAELVRTIIAMAKNMELHAVAEGVETLEQMRALQELGCEYGQGYYFARPLPLPLACQTALRLNASVCAPGRLSPRKV